MVDTPPAPMRAMRLCAMWALALAGGSVSEFSERVRSKRTAFVNFFSSSDAISLEFAAVWDAVAREFEQSSTVMFDSVDCAALDARRLCDWALTTANPSPHSGAGYPRPMIYMPPHMTPESYEGLRTVEDIAEHTRFIDQRCDIRKPESCTYVDRREIKRFTYMRLKELNITYLEHTALARRANFALLRAQLELRQIDSEKRKTAYALKLAEIEKATAKVKKVFPMYRDLLVLMKQRIDLLVAAGVQPEDPPPPVIRKPFPVASRAKDDL